MASPHDWNRLWIAWAVIAVGGFAALETWGLWNRKDTMKPLTFHVRRGMNRYPLAGPALASGLAWFAFHILVEPFWRQRRRDQGLRERG